MANERGFGKGIIRLEGSALARPAEVSVPGQLTPAALELITGIRAASGAVVNSIASHRSSDFQKPSFVIPAAKNFTDDWWGE